ncbi:MAG TPA: hypothetical protein VFZ24_14855 [Longimicrobiales bacterium]
MYFFISLGMLVLIAGVLYRARWLRRMPDPAAPALTDDMVRQIEESGYIEVDEPLDLEQIQDEETRFWNEASWEEPEEL